jgi:hypothetical protein
MFRKEFPRMYELRDPIKSPDSLNPFWKDLDVTFQDPVKGSVMRRASRPIEAALQSLDSDAWEFLKNEAAGHLTKWDEKNARGQQQLIDILNQARAYYYLNEIGCSDIHFISRSRKEGIKTPDLEGIFGDIKIICEVKTINISKNEAEIRREMSRGFSPRPIRPQAKLEQGFFNKLRDDLTIAKSQIEAYAAGNKTRALVYIILNLDNMWEDYKEEDYKEIDDFLSKNIIQGIEIVFHNRRTVSNEIITMKNATVFNEPEYF